METNTETKTETKTDSWSCAAFSSFGDKDIKASTRIWKCQAITSTVSCFCNHQEKADEAFVCRIWTAKAIRYPPPREQRGSNEKEAHYENAKTKHRFKSSSTGRSEGTEIPDDRVHQRPVQKRQRDQSTQNFRRRACCVEGQWINENSPTGAWDRSSRAET